MSGGSRQLDSAGAIIVTDLAVANGSVEVESKDRASISEHMVTVEVDGAMFIESEGRYTKIDQHVTLMLTVDKATELAEALPTAMANAYVDKRLVGLGLEHLIADDGDEDDDEGTGP